MQTVYETHEHWDDIAADDDNSHRQPTVIGPGLYCDTTRATLRLPTQLFSGLCQCRKLHACSLVIRVSIDCTMKTDTKKQLAKYLCSDVHAQKMSVRQRRPAVCQSAPSVPPTSRPTTMLMSNATEGCVVSFWLRGTIARSLSRRPTWTETHTNETEKNLNSIGVMQYYSTKCTYYKWTHVYMVGTSTRTPSHILYIASHQLSCALGWERNV